MGAKLTQEEVEKRVKDSFLERVEVISKYISKRELLEIHCLECDHKWSTRAQNVLYVDVSKAGMHRCPSCGTNKTGRLFKCSYCGKEIYRSQKNIDKNSSGHFYCSRECGNRHKNQLRKESGEWDEGISNYRLRAMEYYEHKCLCCGWNEDERILEAHHIDEDRGNSHISNLCLLCPTCHRKITLGYYELDVENKRLIEVKPR